MQSLPNAGKNSQGISFKVIDSYCQGTAETPFVCNEGIPPVWGSD